MLYGHSERSGVLYGNHIYIVSHKESVPIYREEILTANSAKAILTTAFPEFRGAHVELLDEGWDFQVFEVDARWLFRFPKREGGVAKLNKERKLLSGLGEWVSLPVPNYENRMKAQVGHLPDTGNCQVLVAIPRRWLIGMRLRGGWGYSSQDCTLILLTKPEKQAYRKHVTWLRTGGASPANSCKGWMV